ncbi:MAG: DSD1 family PLP-dependent enzyme [Acidiferrobacterales bacterium]
MHAPVAAGVSLRDVDTPALLIDLDAFEGNLKRMADIVAATGARLRAHSKTHKSPIVARRQMALGAVGVCCQKVSEAEVMVQGGVDNVLVSNEVVGAPKIERLVALARSAQVAVCADNEANVLELGMTASRLGVRLDVLVEIDVGAGRCGVPPGRPAVALAQAIAAAPSLRFAGLQAYHGSAQHIRDYSEREAAIDRAIELTRETVNLLAQAGLTCNIVGGGGTGTHAFEAASGVYNELQAGSYVFMDADYARNRGKDGGAIHDFRHALFIYTTVMSITEGERAIVDAGLKAFSVDSGMPEPYGLDRVTFGKASDEHGVLNIEATHKPPNFGNKVLLIPGHCDPTVNLHDWYVCVRGLGTSDAYVEAVWPVAARGCVF